jgi:hypothetical protein
MAIDLVPLGVPAQFSGGLTGRGAAQVYLSGMMFLGIAALDTVITVGAVTVIPDPSSPQPDSDATLASAAAAAATRPGIPGRLRPIRSTRHPPPRPILGPAGGSASR